MDKPWKQFERFVAGIFSSTRNALSGGNSKLTRSDSIHPHLFISCKYTRHNHKQLRDLVKEEREKAAVEGKVAVCVVGEFDDRANALVIMHLKDIKPFTELVTNGTVQIDMVTDKKRPQRKRSGNVVG